MARPNDTSPAAVGESAGGASPAVLAEAVDRCRACSELSAELVELYRQVDFRVGRTGAVCLGGGACCRFDLADHRLYVSTGELALLTREAPVSPAPPGKCAYQLGPRCIARDRRPLGCRTYFCNRLHDGDLSATYEDFHRRLRRLHERLGLPYYYVELTAALASYIPRRRWP